METKILTIQGIRSGKPLPRGIQFFMWLYAKLRGLPGIKCCNHWSAILDSKEYEAVADGVVKVDYDISTHKYVKEWKILIKGKKKIDEVYKYLEAQVGKKYEISNFFFHILKVFGFKWHGIYNDNKHSCIELVNRVLQIAGVEGINKFDNPYETQVKLDGKFEGKVIKGD